MSRRRSSGDQEFGSDSFLDIIANIVGILIILIVIAGVKVARQTAVVSPEETPVVQEIATDAGEDSVLTPPATVEADTVDDVESPEVQAAIASLHEPEVEVDQIAELDRRIEQLSRNLSQTRDTAADTESELHELLALVQERKEAEHLQTTQMESLRDEKNSRRQSVRSLTASLADADRTSKNFQATITSLTRRQRYVASALKQVALQTRQLREVLEEAERSEPEGERLNHRLSPVGRSVTDAELHFRLRHGRIAHVPIDALVERLKHQVLARRNLILRFQRHEGVVGPVGGFLMKYTVERETQSPIEALQSGNGGYRVAISGWTIVPGDTLVAEPVDAALRIGSRFRQILEAADTDTTITIWLYAEDFEHFRPLRELAHNLNLRVAARPLPADTPIAGSPNGSRSTSQ